MTFHQSNQIFNHQLAGLLAREGDKARHIDDTQRLVTEIEILKFVLCLVQHHRYDSPS
jgi:hypothetical protein